MKVVLTGSTGFIGSAVLQHCLENKTITSVVALSRRQVEVKDEKLQTLIVKDFQNYDEETIDKIKGADACVWCLGKPSNDRVANYDYAVAGMNAIESTLAGSQRTDRFRFVYVSGAAIEADQNKSLWFMAEARHMRGELENFVRDFETSHSSTWRSVVARPAFVLKKETLLGKTLLSSYSVTVDDLAAALVDAAVNGSEIQTLSNGALKQRGKAVLTK